MKPSISRSLRSFIRKVKNCFGGYKPTESASGSNGDGGCSELIENAIIFCKNTLIKEELNDGSKELFADENDEAGKSRQIHYDYAAIDRLLNRDQLGDEDATMDDEEDDGFLKAFKEELNDGSKELFADENDEAGKSRQIHYDDAAIDRLLNRDQLGDEDATMDDEEDDGFLKAFKGAGLANLGNTCFLNAILQCCTHIVPLVQGLRSYNHPRPCDRDNEGFCVICTLRDHIEYSITSMDRVVSPWKLVDNLNYISSNFRRFQQEDAHEFLQCLLDRLDSCCIYSQTKDTSLPSADESLVKQVFGGRLISKLQCCNCGHSSDTYEHLIDLSLEIENVGTLPSALESFTKVEKIEDPETKFTCEQCKEKVLLLLLLHLKRFKNDGSYVEKIDKHVEFPLELDLLPYTGGDQNNDVELKYNLYAVVVHIGFSSTSGHYYCFIRSAPDAWYRLDDSKVTTVREDFVLSQEAYILFYAKEGTPWFSSFMETEKSSIDPNLFSNSPQSVLDNVDRIGTSSPNVADNCSGEVNEAGEVAVGISVDSFNKRTHNSVEVDEAKDDSHRLFTPGPPVMSNSSSETAYKVERKFSPSALRDNNSNRELNKVAKNVNIIPSTPPRSPSPDIYAEEPPTVTYSIPRNHLISEKQVPNDRSAKLLAAMNGSHSEGRRTRRIESSSNRNERPSSALKLFVSIVVWLLGQSGRAEIGPAHKPWVFTSV
ncbi:Ubiquitin carboxyl-terminal hydrolase 20 [Camellia lanceoleosa]|uniref:Ubiquitin carboxyl-terminal hydrolase 20 n=1 Tax=Camellia lanceoleosa TaxID=1840588 RepID=A0ACC0FQT1_9ERIC|nr:Ubiquitin carboxyl-terminal hydrolase 20 [Camellia lanceoleosa]